MKLGYFIIYVPNVPDTIQFYQKAFDLKAKFINDDKTFGELDTGSASLAFADESLRYLNGIPSNNNHSQAVAGTEPALVALIAQDVNQAYDHAVSAGAVAIKAPYVAPWGQTISYVKDCSGFLVEICSQI